MNLKQHCRSNDRSDNTKMTRKPPSCTINNYTNGNKCTTTISTTTTINNNNNTILTLSVPVHGTTTATSQGTAERTTTGANVKRTSTEMKNEKTTTAGKRMQE